MLIVTTRSGVEFEPSVELVVWVCVCVREHARAEGGWSTCSFALDAPLPFCQRHILLFLNEILPMALDEERLKLIS